jgi:ABC-type nitrate/sulfonate/bicarbonate transport system ATPase subunit
VVNGAAAALRVEVRRKAFGPIGGAAARPVLRNLAFDCAPGSFTAITGPSGIGKTTLLNLVAGLDTDFEGHVERRATARIGYVFQEPRLLAWRTVEENVRLAMESARPPPDPSVLDELLAAAGLADARLVFPGRLSLGMARRASLVRAFAILPDLLLMDEPFVSLDERTAERLRELLRLLLWRRPATVLFVTHDLREAIRLAGRLLVLNGSPAQLVADLPIALSAEERRDPAAVELASRGLAELVP